MDAIADPALGSVVSQRGGELGAAPLLPGGCFDPDQWLACPAGELRDPIRGPLWERAASSLRGDHRT